MDQELHHSAALGPVAGDDRQHPFDEAAAAWAVGAVARLPPADRVAQRPLGRVVGRLDAVGFREGPEARFHAEQIPADAGGD